MTIFAATEKESTNKMTLENAIKTLDDVIPPHAHRTVDREHMPIALAWEAVKVELENRVPVVRCGECKHAEPYKRTDGATGYYCHCQYSVFEYGDRRKYTPVRESDDYCSYGEREETK